MRIGRRLLQALVLVLTLVVGATAAAIIVSQTSWFKNWLRGYIVAQANQYLNGQLSIGRLGGNLFFGVEMENIGVSMNGSQVVAVKDLGLDYNVFEFLTKGMSVNEIRLNQPTMYLRREGDAWSIAKLVKQQEQEADREGPASPISIDKIGISDASIIIDNPPAAVGTAGAAGAESTAVDLPDRIDRIDAELSFKYEPVHYTIEISHVSFRGSNPAIGLNSLSGIVSVRDDTVFVENLAVRTEESSIAVDGAVQQYLTAPAFNLRVSSDKLSLPELARVLPALAGVRLQPAFEVKVDGPLDRLGVEMNVRSSAGEVDGTFVADVQAPGQSVKGTLSVRHLDLAPLVNDPRQKSDLTATARVDVAAEEFSNVNTLRGTATIDAPRLVAAGYSAERVHADARFEGRRVDINARAGAYGADATTTGRVTLPEKGGALSYDLRGRLRNVDIRRLPRELNVPPAETNVNADYQVRGDTGSGRQRIEGEARFAESTVAGARIERGSTVAFSMAGQDVRYNAHATVAGLDLQRVGREFRVPALAEERFKSNLNAHVSAEGSGTSPREMVVDAQGTLTDSTLFGGRLPELSFDARVADDSATVAAKGSFAEFDPAVASGRADMKGSVGGSVDVNATITGLSGGVTADNVAGSVRASLEPSTIGELAITRAQVDADYANQSGEIRQLEVVGRDVNVKAEGTLALNETGQSNLTFHADSPSLAEIGRLVDAPLEGIAKIDGTLTGNRTELQAKGTLSGSGVEYGENGALTVNGTYSARIPDLAFARASVESDLEATFVTIGGQNINELKAKTTYTDQRVAFDATARQPERTLGAAGALTLHPDHQEVHLDRLELDTRGQQWRLADGGGARIHYGQDRIAVEDIRIVNGAQEIAADGRFGQPGDALRLTIANVDLANVDALMLREPQLSGLLNATATVTGQTSAPEVEGKFEVSKGGFREFRYDALTGTAEYSGAGVNLDTRLQQNAAQWITAKGYLPTALFSRPEGAGGAARGNDRIDLAVDSSPIDLGIVQGFTEAVTGASGTFEAHVRVTGTVDDPQPEGGLTIQDGAISVEPAGVRYTNITGAVQLHPDRVSIPLITVLDNHFNALTVVGDLAVRQRQVGGVHVYINAEDFKILDNELGEVRIQSAMEIAGELRAPAVQGYLGVTSGNIDLDRIVALAGPSAYATKQTEFETDPSAPPAGRPQASPSVFNALRMDVHLTVPDAFVVRADSLQTPGSTMSLGALNVTLGGDLRAMKEPGGQVRLLGAVNTVRGNYDFQGRRFEILRDGTVRFAGLEQFNPILDLRTRRIIQGVEARVNVRGSLQQPEINLSSTPPLEQADILALIVFNQPLNELGEGQQISLAQRAQALATGAVAGQLAQSIGNALNLDTFEINLAPETGGGPEVTLGQQVGSNLYLKVQQGVGENTTTNVVLEYELTEWLRLQTNFLQGATTQNSLFRRAQGSGGDLIFFFSY
jgi:autotransporter translocation and assembly factor TamB